MPAGGDDLNVFQPRGSQAAGDETSGLLDVRLVLGQGADARNAKEGIQLLQEPASLLLDKCINRLWHPDIPPSAEAATTEEPL